MVCAEKYNIPFRQEDISFVENYADIYDFSFLVNTLRIFNYFHILLRIHTLIFENILFNAQECYDYVINVISQDYEIKRILSSDDV